MTEAEGLIRRWLHDCVLALELCPFAAPVMRDESLRIAVSASPDHAGQLRDFLEELDLLQGSSERDIATSLLVYCQGPEEFEDFLALVDDARDLLEQAGLQGLVQLAHFHPHYQFAGVPGDDLSHYTNRSPLPIIHLLRESMMTRLLETFPDPAAIPQRNIETLRKLGRSEIERRWGYITPR